MKFYLDGYNIIGSADHISLADKDKIEVLIRWLKRYQKKGQQLVIIFDGQNEFMQSPTKERLPGITIIHTSATRSADEYIKEKIIPLKDTANKVIVTSDRDILFHAKKAKFKTMKSDQFLAWFCKDDPELPSKKSPSITERHVDFWLNEFGNSG